MQDVIFPNLGIAIDHLPRVAFNLFGLPIYWYGITMVSGVMLAVLLCEHLCIKQGLGRDVFNDFIFFGIVGSLIVARTYYVIFSWDYYKDNLIKIFAFREGGIAMFGTLIGGTLTSFLYCKYKKISFGHFIDVAACGLCLGQCIGRFGNFFNREAFGVYTDSLFAMQYVAEQVGSIPADMPLFTVNNIQYIQVHPAFLYEAAWNLLLLFILLSYHKRKRFNGEVFMFYMAGYGLGRFFIESIRTDALYFFNTSIRISQLLAGLAFLVGLTTMIVARAKGVRMQSLAVAGAEDGSKAESDSEDSEGVSDEADDEN